MWALESCLSWKEIGGRRSTFRGTQRWIGF
ncbi:hypothetical protein NFI96_034412 [Prochilodus magdalenae]|nr:hypothetical protein NFI96_034412 [Prochilodus magdalenae]